jgi:hypothetical protein
MGKQQQQALKALDQRLNIKERTLAATYRDALISIRGSMSRIYDKYAINGKLTKAEMTKYNRYASMEKLIIKELSPAVAKSVRDIKRLAPSEYEAAFFRMAWALDNENGVRLNWGLVNKDAVQAALDNEYTKIAVKGLVDNSRLAVRRALTDGLALGKSYPQMVKDLKKATNATYAQAIRILRTEGQDAQNAGANATYTKADDLGIEGAKVWDATLDGDTRPTHQTQDGKKADAKGLFYPGGNPAKYPSDSMLPAGERINCRCRIRYEVEGYSPQIRRTREQGIIPYQTYPDWVKTYGKPKSRK